MEFSIGASFAHLDVHTALAQLPKQAWNPAYQARKPRPAETGVQIEPRDGAWVAEATGLLQLRGWPEGTRWSAVLHTIVLRNLELLDLILRRRQAFRWAVIISVLVLAAGLAWRVPLPQLPELHTLPVPQLLH